MTRVYTANRRSKLALMLSLIMGLMGGMLASPAHGQDTPLLSGGAGFFKTTNGGSPSFGPFIAPVVAAPIGQNLLAEARFDFRDVVLRENGRSGPYDGTFFKATQALQLDYIATPRLTAVFGRFLTPFGIYNERLSSVWIQNFQNAPIVFAIGTRTSGSNDGLMLRGVALSTAKVQLNYVADFSVRSNIGQFQTARSAGDRLELVFPGKRVEIGTSYARFLQDTRYNSIGAHFVWLPWSFPLQVRSEYAHGPHAQGYWMETSYRLSQWHGPDSLLGRLEPLFRMQQSFRNSPGNGDGLPGVDTKLADFGLDYHLPREVRVNSSFSRKFAANGNANIWSVSLIYRFLTPAWPGKKS